MKVALIPPLCQLYRAMDRPYQMIIPEGLKWPNYRAAYYALAGQQFTMLDNGMFESSMIKNEDLIDTALRYKVSEIVMPDVKDNMEETLLATDNFLDMFLESEACEKKIGLQMVVQVSNESQIPDFIDMAQELEWKHFGHSNVFTFGIPRRMVEKFGDHARCATADFISAVTPNPIHLLGYARTQDPNFNETKKIAKLDQVRSMDTDAPFIWTSCGAKLGDGIRHQRTGKYLNLEMTLFPIDLVTTNIDLLDEWSTGA